MATRTALDPALSVGIPSIDAEHAELLAELNRLIHDLPLCEPDSEPFSKIISDLGGQLIQHFDNEEEVLRTCGMPEAGVAEHIQAHTAILQQYGQLQIDMMSGRVPGRVETLQMIRSWILSHLLEYDLKIRPYASGKFPR